MDAQTPGSSQTMGVGGGGGEVSFCYQFPDQNHLSSPFFLEALFFSRPAGTWPGSGARFGSP